MAFTNNTFAFKSVLTAALMTAMQANDDAVRDNTAGYIAAGGTADVSTLTFSPAFTAYADGQEFAFKPVGTNTITMTLNVNALGAKTIQKVVDGALTNLAAGDVTSAILVKVRYSTTSGTLILYEISKIPHLNAANIFTKTNSLAKGADVASGAALTLGSDGNYFDITGTTTITSIATIGIGTVVTLHFDAALTLTHHATDLVLPGAANIITVAGDEFTFVEYATGDWRMIGYSRIPLLKKKVIDIGDWNMDTTSSVFVNHGLSLGDIRSVKVLIRDDADIGPVMLPTANSAGTTDEGITLSSTQVKVYRSTTGTFDSVFYDSTSFNRGWITIEYV